MPESLPLAPKYKRVLLKLSGEAFGISGKSGISVEETVSIAEQIKTIVARGVQLAVVVGGGNLIRGATFAAGSPIHAVTADNMGMLATVMNGLALQDILERLNVPTRVMSAVRIDSVAEPFIRRRAVRHLEKGRVVILVGGTGNPYVTTDTAAALRGRELAAEVILKATRVDGIYTADPEKNPHAVKYDKLSYQKVLQDRLNVMDLGAFEMCREAKLSILVFNYKQPDSIARAVAGHAIGTLVSGE